MSTPPTTTPSSGKSQYFDAPVAHFSANSDKDMSAATTDEHIAKGGAAGGAGLARNPSVANPAIAPTNGVNGHGVNGNGKAPETAAAVTEEEEEGEAPEYSPGPDDKLSRSYGTDAKTASTTTDAAATAAAAPIAAADTQPASPPSPASLSAKTTPDARSGSGHNQQGSTFANGAAVTGPNAAMSPEEEAALHLRSATAESGLSEKTKGRLSKAELKDNKRLSKIIRAEAKAEAAALKAAIAELAQLQGQQGAATKREAAAAKSQAKALSVHMKTESRYMALKAAHERDQGDLRGKEEALAVEQANAREVSERTGEKAREVERLRLQTAADERERAAKLEEMGTSEKGGCVIC
ncbi:hypothetical protein FIBSPDRAFT_859294 [Athelia psychrophila]|uniref:DNA binding protein Ncp1 n=1 Tax=Athelia psychrophila TaxID=1759441 RepID=A0A166LCX6_9AGAM|nr:hypothetical protein FIBSPDRAFT_859294 [Fibularhizoctonia sp. CBS 109695]